MMIKQIQVHNFVTDKIKLLQQTMLSDAKELGTTDALNLTLPPMPPPAQMVTNSIIIPQDLPKWSQYPFGRFYYKGFPLEELTKLLRHQMLVLIHSRHFQVSLQMVYSQRDPDPTL
ncbi:hypothetical protein [Tabrizicola sp.]|uniref:hypothetical protein n=1 Tax=Tabrizicola sp. TaxID=2005166 RepID=UPI002869FD3C|nr:hypothetical protein [Tabrizicola sp.]